MQQTIEHRLVKARVALLLDEPFFGTLATRLTNVIDPSIPTACTDGKVIRWSPQFVKTLTDAELRAVYAHEVMHCSNGHTWRRGSRDPYQWNVSADLAINYLLKQCKFTLPKGALTATPAQQGKSAEALYEAPKKGGNGSGGTESEADPGSCGGVDDAPQEDQAELEADWKVAIAQAAMAAKSQGKLPGCLERLIDEIVNPKIPWEVVLRDFVERTARNDYNWSVPNRRYLSGGICLPSLVSEELPAIVIAIDTSGSIGGTELDQFAAEVSAVLGAYETTIHIVYADARVAHHHIVTRAELPLKLQPRGGGGTDFRPVFKWVEEQCIEPAALVYLTDGHGSFPVMEASYPVLWVMTTDQKAPTGETIKM